MRCVPSHERQNSPTIFRPDVLLADGLEVRRATQRPPMLPENLRAYRPLKPSACARASWAMSTAATPDATFWTLLKFGPARDVLRRPMTSMLKNPLSGVPHRVLSR